MGHYLSWIANAALLAACCFLVANTANAIFAAMLTPAPTAVAAAPPSASPAAARSWTEHKKIVERNLFNSSTLKPPPPPVQEAEDLEATRLPLRLLGTAAANDVAWSWAAVEDLERRETRVVRVDDEIKRGATVLRIERRRIVLDENGSRRELALDDESVRKSEPAPSRSRASARRRSPRRRSTALRTPTAPEVRQVEEDRFEVPREDVLATMADPTSLFSQARIGVKTGDDGEVIGLEIRDPKPGSVFQEVGIQSGEVITHVNGIRISSAEDSRQLLSELTENSELTVVVEGAGGIRTLSLEF